MIKLTRRSQMLFQLGLLLYNAVLVYALATTWLLFTQFKQLPWVVITIVAPVGIHYTLSLCFGIGRVFDVHISPKLKPLNQVLGWYSGFITSLLFIMLLTSISNLVELIYTASLVPLVLHHWQGFVGFWLRRIHLYAKVLHKVVTKRKESASRVGNPEPEKSDTGSNLDLKDPHASSNSNPDNLDSPLSSEIIQPEVPILTEVKEEPNFIKDLDRRQFLKLIGASSLGVTVLSLIMPQKANAAFFGSVPGPGVVALKDSSGNKIDPKEKSPTDGYSISEIDDDDLPSYYGFVNKDGAWYISKEDSSGSYRYAKGSANFATNWTGRALLSYDYFDAVFS